MDAVKFLEEWKRMCNSYEADCQECFGFGGTRRTAIEAIEAWNRRVEP